MRSATVLKMPSSRHLFVSVCIVVSALTLAVVVGETAARSQQGGYGRGQQNYGQQSASSSGRASLTSVVARMSQAAGIQILADRAVANDSVTAPTAPTTASNVDSQIQALVAQLPSGSVSGKFYLPTASSQSYTADNVEALAMAEARLFGPVGGPQTGGTVEIMGQKVSSEKASTVIAALNLQPVYLIGNPSSGQQSQGQQSQGQGQYPTSGNGGSSAATGTVSQQAQSLLNMSASERDQALMQMMSQNQQVISQVMQNVSPAERQQILQSLRGASGGNFGGGRGGPGGGGPGGPGGGGN